MSLPAAASRTVPVVQGEFKVSSDPDEVLVTILGSCVATCLYDAEAGIGGLNHFLLPKGSGSGAGSLKYGAHAMELLINALLKGGAHRPRLRAKLFGGANMIDGLSDIGAANARFAREFLANEGILCLGESLGGNQARKIRFTPCTGAAQQMLVGRSALAAFAPPKAPVPPPVQDDVTLF